VLFEKQRGVFFQEILDFLKGSHTASR